MNAVRVAKVGGSLFDYEDLVPSLRKWLALQPPLATVLIAGGGPFADAIRAVDARFGLGEEASHWLCVRALGVSARLLAALLPEAKFAGEGVGSLVRRLETVAMKAALGESDSRPFYVLDPETFLCSEEPLLANPLPHTWSVTSDSIAARLAEALGAQELVLLKSSFGFAVSDIHAAAEAGFVDAEFPRAAATLQRVRAVNLRDERFAETRLA
jgi:aspartokinase-like uncharacterized kinase